MQEERFVVIKIIDMESSIIINIYEIVFSEAKVIDLSIITINHINTGAMTAAGTRSLLWRTRLLDAGMYNFLSHTLVRYPGFSGHGVQCSIFVMFGARVATGTIMTSQVNVVASP